MTILVNLLHTHCIRDIAKCDTKEPLGRIITNGEHGCIPYSQHEIENRIVFNILCIKAIQSFIFI